MNQELIENRKLESINFILADIEEALDPAGQDRTEIENRASIDDAVGWCDQAREIALAHNQPWLAAYIDLKKAALYCELAKDANYIGRGVHIFAAMELVNQTLAAVPGFPPSLDLAARLYLSVIETLFRVRALLDKPEQLEALDALIRGAAENLGEYQAADLLYRAEANHLTFSAGVLELVAEVNPDSGDDVKLIAAAQQLRREAAVLNALTSASQTPGRTG